MEIESEKMHTKQIFTLVVKIVNLAEVLHFVGDAVRLFFYPVWLVSPLEST